MRIVASGFLLIVCYFHLLPAKPANDRLQGTGILRTLSDTTMKSIPKENFIRAYRAFIVRWDEMTITLKNGAVFKWDDGVNKSFEQKFENADIEDMLSIQYVPGSKWGQPPAKNNDPGRIRNDQFFKCIYGKTEVDVRANCTAVQWFTRKVLFNKNNGAADSLKKVAGELMRLPKQFHKYFTTTAGTFNWRKIAGTGELSMHSFAVAIDLNPKYSHYWRNSSVSKYINNIPDEIVEVFENHGFIWGGKWYHYDTMHFEFRPEFFVK